MTTTVVSWAAPPIAITSASNNVQVGQLMGQGLVDCISAWKVTDPNILIMDGDPTDNNAKLFAQGYNGVLDPHFSDKSYTKVCVTEGVHVPAGSPTFV